MSERAVIVGKRVKAMRMQKGISQSELAHRVGISQAHMSNIENGHSNITLENLFALHDILGVSMASFFVDIDNDEKQDISEEKDYIGLSDMIDALLLIKNRKLSSRVLKEAVEEEAKEYAYSIKDEPYHMLVGSGNLWGSTYCFAMCYLEEMQWIHTKSITAPEFFHGTLELLEEDTSIMIFKGEDETRVLAERVENFAKKISKKVKVVDTKAFPAEGIADKYRSDFAPFFLEAYLGRLIANLEDATGHSLDIRRYYRVMDY